MLIVRITLHLVISKTGNHKMDLGMELILLFRKDFSPKLWKSVAIYTEIILRYRSLTWNSNKYVGIYTIYKLLKYIPFVIFYLIYYPELSYTMPQTINIR